MAQPSTTPQRWIAFLRAINVGGHTVKMDRLRQLFAELELTNVATFIASGNVIFDAPDEDAVALAQRIESHLRQALGYAVATFIRSDSELAEVARYRPFAPGELDAEGHSLYIMLLPAAPSAEARQKLAALRTDVDDFHLHGRELYWLCRTRLSESTVSGAMLEKAIGLPGTIRNSTTVRKLAAKYPAAPGADNQ